MKGGSCDVGRRWGSFFFSLRPRLSLFVFFFSPPAYLGDGASGEVRTSQKGAEISAASRKHLAWLLVM